MLFAISTAALSLCGCEKITPQICPLFPNENGLTVVTGEGSNVRLRLPAWAAVIPSSDCSRAKSVNMNFLWYQGKLYPMDGKFELSVPPDDYQRVWAGFEGFFEKNELLQRKKEAPAWPYEEGVPHQRYPLEFYPHSTESARSSSGLVWGVRNTVDPITGRPIRASCDIVPTSKDVKSAARGEFSRHGDSKCTVRLRLVNDEKAAAVAIYVWAKSADHIDQIVNSIQFKLTTTIRPQ